MIQVTFRTYLLTNNETQHSGQVVSTEACHMQDDVQFLRALAKIFPSSSKGRGNI